LVGQQLSVKAAASIHQRFEAQLCHRITPESVFAAATDDLRSAGLSGAKVEYCKALAEAVIDGRLAFEALASMPLEDAADYLCKVKGIGPWTAHIYLLFCEGRPDVWPAGDLALQEAVKRLKGLPKRPTADETKTLTASWQPYRGAMAIFLWHYYAASDAPV
jgi:DNA-3-methyladenine glycosylase II